MPKKKAEKPRVRKVNFPLLFWDGLKERATAAAKEDFGGNLTTYINATIQADLKARDRNRGK